MRRLRSAFAFTQLVMRHMLRDRASLFFTLVLPVVVIVIIGATFGGRTRVEIGLLEEGSGPLAARVGDELRSTEGIRVRAYENGEELRRAVRRQLVAAGLVVPGGFDAAVRDGRTAEVKLVVVPTSEQALIARVSLEGVLDSVAARLGAARFAAEQTGRPFSSTLALADGGAGWGAAIDVQDVGASRAADLSRFSLVAPQQLVLFVFINSMASAGLIVTARRAGVLRRAVATPTGTGAILLGLGAGWFVFALFQSVAILLVGALLFGVGWGDPVGAGLLVVTFALVGCGAGLLVGAVGRDADRVSAVTPILGIVLGALGGCMAPLEIFPPAMLAAAHATPHYWAVTAWETLVVDGDGALAIAGSLGVLLALAGLFGAAATVLLRRDLVH